jgi:DNA-binding beta-propeller fold protein YncE
MTTQGSNKLKVIDGPTLTGFGELSVRAKSDSLRGVTVDSNSNKIYVVNAGHNSSSQSSQCLLQ